MNIPENIRKYLKSGGYGPSLQRDDPIELKANLKALIKHYDHQITSFKRAGDILEVVFYKKRKKEIESFLRK